MKRKMKRKFQIYKIQILKKTSPLTHSILYQIGINTSVFHLFYRVFMRRNLWLGEFSEQNVSTFLAFFGVWNQTFIGFLFSLFIFWTKFYYLFCLESSYSKFVILFLFWFRILLLFKFFKLSLTFFGFYFLANYNWVKWNHKI